VRKPVNAPGPRPKAIASSSRSATPACASSARMAGISVADACAPPAASNVRTSPRAASAMLRCSVAVSNASRVAFIRVAPRRRAAMAASESCAES